MPTLQSAFDDFMLALRADGLSRATVDWYRWTVGAFIAAHDGETRLVSEITVSDCRRYIVTIRGQGYAEDTVAAHIRGLHRFWKFAASEYRLADPMQTIRYPQPRQPQPKAADMGDIIAMFAHAGEGGYGVRNRAILAFLLDTGCRAAGLVRLRLSDLDLGDRRAIITEKGSRTRAVTFTEVTAELLRQWLEIREKEVKEVFYNLDTLEALTRNGLYQALRRMARRAGITGRFNPHSFRHAFAREYIKAGGDIVTLSMLMGHRETSTTARHYLIFSNREVIEAHEKYSPAKLLPGAGEDKETTNE